MNSNVSPDEQAVVETCQHELARLLFNGWTWIMLSLVIRKLPEPGETLTG